MQQRNTLIFIALSLLVLYTSFQLQNWMARSARPEKKVVEKPPEKVSTSLLAGEVVGRTSAAFALAPAGIGVGPSCQLAAACQTVGSPEVAALATRPTPQVAAAKPPPEKKEPPKPSAPPPATT